MSEMAGENAGTVTIDFRYCPGVSTDPFTEATLVGSWDSTGAPSADRWSSLGMTRTVDPDGAVAYSAMVDFDAAYQGASYSWGVRIVARDGSLSWGIAAEVADENSGEQTRTLILPPPSMAGSHVERYRLTYHRVRGATRAGDQGDSMGFSVWAPNARAVEVVFGLPGGYVANDGEGEDPEQPAVPLIADGAGMWTAARPDFASFVGRPYMYRVVQDDGSTAYATDMFSREQIGRGDFDPNGAPYHGRPEDLNGRPSCSVVVDPRTVAGYPPGSGDGVVQTDAAFWSGEFAAGRPVPSRVQDLVIYELHVGGLNAATSSAGTFADALDFVPYLVDLGVNAVELMPMFQFDGTLSWGYGSSQFLAIDAAAGGRDGLKAFVKRCHQQGVAVIMDVVYNHYTDRAARAAWQYDSRRPSRNFYYWYEGAEGQYADPSGGYLDNGSSGWAPNYSEEHVRALFTSSAALLAEEFHIDGLRVDQTASIHSYNRLHADGSPVPSANVLGRKFLRELCETLKLLDGDCVLIAEDHSGWPAVTQPASSGGIGFDATWYVDFYHHLVGEDGRGPEWAKLLLTAARDQVGPLAMDYFAGALTASANQKVVYESSHDEAGNDEGTERTILVAVNGAPLVGETRRYAEARCRFACGMSMFSAGTPMFLMGEEVGAEKAYTYDKFYEEKEDLPALRAGSGANLFRFYQDAIRLRLASTALRSRNIEIVQVDNASRLIAFRRWDEQGDFLVVGSLNNLPFQAPGYGLRHPSLGSSGWRECLNSDSSAYGGDNAGNQSATLTARDGYLSLIVPANAVLVLVRA